MFALPEHIENYAAQVLGQLAAEQHLRGLPREQFAERLTHYCAEINAVHPFREGNGRAQRVFMRQLASTRGTRSPGSAWTRGRSSTLRSAASRATTF